MNNNTNLVRMSGQFWRLSVDGESVVLTSTVRGFRAMMTFAAFTSAIVRGTIQMEGGI